MKNVLLIATLLLCTKSFSQKCKVKYDDFTHAKIISSDLQKIGYFKGGGWDFKKFISASIISSDSIYLLALYPQFDKPQTIQKGDEILFLFDDGKIGKFYSSSLDMGEIVSGKAFSQGTNTRLFENSIKINLTFSQFNYLRDHIVTKIRIAGGYDYTIDYPLFFQKTIQNIEKL